MVDKIVLRCPTLTELQLNGCTSLTDHSISVLAQVGIRTQQCHLIRGVKGLFHNFGVKGSSYNHKVMGYLIIQLWCLGGIS